MPSVLGQGHGARAMLLGLLVTGCTAGPRGSDELSTKEIHARFGVWANAGPQASVWATLSVGDDPVILHEQDRLFCNGVELVSSGGRHQAFATPSPSAQGTPEFRFELRRMARGEVASIAVEAPAPFALTSPPEALRIGFPLTLTWSPSGTNGELEVQVAGVCVVTGAFPGLPDTGRALVGPIDGPSGSRATGCSGEMAILRWQGVAPASDFASALVDRAYEERRSINLDP